MGRSASTWQKGDKRLATVQQITTVDEWRKVQADSCLSLVFKHSTTCPISAGAHDEFLRWAAGLPEERVHLYRVHVIEDRPLSQRIAADTGVTHQSPQALLMRSGKVLWHASHYAITEPLLAAAAADPGRTPGHSTSLVQAQAERKAQMAAGARR